MELPIIIFCFIEYKRSKIDHSKVSNEKWNNLHIFVCEEVSVFFLTFFVACEFIFTITFLFGTTSTWKMINDVLIWKCFLSYINNLYFFYFQQHGPNNSLARLWWFPLFKYFEKNIGGPVPRQYDWPLPWPRRFLTKHPNRDS